MADEIFNETKHYEDGSSATGPAPLPDHSPTGSPAIVASEPLAGDPFVPAEASPVIPEHQPPAAWTDEGQGAGLDYPVSTDNYHSGTEEPKKLTGEARIDALVIFLQHHGIHVPYEIAPED